MRNSIQVLLLINSLAMMIDYFYCNQNQLSMRDLFSHKQTVYVLIQLGNDSVPGYCITLVRTMYFVYSASAFQHTIMQHLLLHHRLFLLEESIRKMLDKHESSSDHQLALEKGEHFLKIMRNSGEGITIKLDKQNKIQRKRI